MNAFFDTSVLVAAFYDGHEHHESSFDLFSQQQKSAACTAAHCERVKRYAVSIALELGLGEDEVQRLEAAAQAMTAAAARWNARLRVIKRIAEAAHRDEQRGSQPE